MTKEFRRTGATDLTDAELMLFDALFDVRANLSFLQRKNFGPIFNFPYDHGLDDVALDETLARLGQRGLVRYRRTRSASPGRLHTRFSLTAKGGTLWARERQPDWMRYCSNSAWTRGPNHWLISIQSPSLKTARAFLETETDCGRYETDAKAVIVRRRERHKLVPWRSFRVVYDLRFVQRAAMPPFDAGQHQRASAEYDRRRIWWGNIAELARWGVA